MIGSEFSISGPNIVLNTAVAEILRQFADALETSKDFKTDLAALVKKTFHEHKRIVFNGNNYSGEWVTEAQKRGLLNFRTTVDALPAFVSSKSVGLFTKHHVFSESELHSRYEILLEGYCKTLNIEALTMVSIVKGEIIPSCLDYQNELAGLLKRKKACGEYDVSLESYLLEKIAKLSARLLEKLTALENLLAQSKEGQEILAQAGFYRDKVFTAMSHLRQVADELETLVAEKHWSLPTYAEILYSVD
jgi:glutamine synthetase